MDYEGQCLQPRRPPEVDQAPKPHTNASAGHEDMLFVATVAKVSDPGLLDSPESTSSDVDSDQVLSPVPDARRIRSPDPKGADGSDVLMKIPRVIRTYTRKIKHVPFVRKDISTKSQTQSFTSQGALLDRLLDDGSDTPIEQLASRENLNIRPAKKRNPTIAVKRKQQSLQNDEGIRREDRSEADADVETSEKNKKTKRKKRRAPVNQLALVARLPSPNGFKQSHNSDGVVNPVDGSVNKEESPTTTSPAKSMKLRANVGRPVTRIRHEIIMPQWEVLDRGRFKVLPNTPRATKSPGWKLGSGFDGISMEPSTNMRLRASRKRKVGNTRTPHVLGQSLPKLDLSAGSSPTRHFVGQRGIPSRQQNHCGPELVEKLDTADGAFEGGPAQSAVKTCGEAASGHVATSTAPIHSPVRNDRSGTASSSHHGGILKGPTQLHPSQSKDLDASQTIREPSRSERNGWLKRRKVDFAIADEDEERLFAHTVTAPVHGSRERRESGRNCVDRYLKDTTRAQHAAGVNPQAFNRGGQTTQIPQRPATSQKQESMQDKPSAGQHRRLVSRDIGAESSNSEEAASTHQRLNKPPEPPPSLQSETDFPASAFHPPNPSMSKAKSYIQVSRTSEIPETQEVLQEESTDLDARRTEPLNPDDRRHPFDETATLDPGGYFLNAVQQLESPETVPHTITRRRSRREPDQNARGSSVMSGRMLRGVSSHHVKAAPFVVGEQGAQKQEGVLQLGVTPRLKRGMSNVPFRPAFMESL